MSINARSVGAISRRFFFLDYLRVFAFVTVLIGHKFYSKIEAFSKDETVHATSRLFASCVEAIVKGGGTGVVVFFLVSGYIITHVLQKEDTVEFVIKRLFRIYPLFVAAVLIEYALDLHHGVPRGKWNLLMQLSLMGDFTTTPGVLNSVDWTLRIEVLFYLFMAVLSALKIVRGDGRVLACVFLTATVALGQFGPFPREKVWSVGYLNIYGPFLFLGAMLYLAETKRITYGALFWFSILVLSQSFSLVERLQPYWMTSHLLLLACLIFLAAWLARNYLQPSLLFTLLSEMTFSVYLFHNWLYDTTLARIGRFKWTLLGKENDALILLLAFCAVMVFAIERPGIRLGRKVASIARVRKANKRHRHSAAPTESAKAI